MKRSIELDWEITHGCNLRSKHCIVNASENIDNDVSLNDVINFLEKLSEHNVLINFTGGEPFYRKDFKEILLYCVKKSIDIQIITNGLLLDSEYIDILKLYNIHLGISVESFNKDSYEMIRGKNTFDKLIDNLDKLNKNNIKFDIYTTINYYNINEFDGIFKYAKKYDCNIHFNDITVDGRAKFNPDLMIYNDNVVNEIVNLSDKYFNIDYLNYDSSCWANNETLFISCNGDIYLCTEEARVCKKSRIGNIKTFPINNYYEKCPTLDYYDKDLQCPYKVYFNERITYNSNVDGVSCSLLLVQKNIDTLNDLYCEFDKLLKDVSLCCKHCSYKDCMGFIWLLQQEKEMYDKNDITTININDNVDFLYFLKDYSDVEISELDFTNIRYPKCEHRCERSGLCQIHKIRPLVCHMYPIGLESIDGNDFWVLHDECEFTQQLIKNNNLNEFIIKLRNIIDSIDEKLYTEIVNKYREVDKISLFLNGINSYIIIKEV